MKRTIFSFAVLLLLSAAASFLASASTTAEPTGDCCITFIVEDANGNPLSGYTVEVLCITCPNPVTCTTGITGECTICDFPSGTYSVTATNPRSDLSGQVDNINCITLPSPFVTIVVQ